ncbi:MAG: EamA family transporter, partial [Deltaproteobacteria bacterium]|nr:EamA family transporter [Deltaproteobacteria bacterium]
AAFWWSLGSTLARFSKMPRSPWWATAIQMLAGGAVMLLLGTLRGEWRQWAPHSVSALSVAAWLYLVFFGSIVGYSAYLWILRNSTPTRVSTYAFVNPAVALFLGWALAGETISPRTFLAAAIILPSVILLITGKEERHDRLRQSQISRGGLDSGMELP